MGGVEVPTNWQVELIVVDNGSTDGTRSWVGQTSLSNMPVRLVEEPRVGQARARNRGLEAARGDILLFTDDDVRVPSNWLRAMTSPLVSGEADAVRGKSVLHPSRKRPWMQVFHRAVLAVTVGVEDGKQRKMKGLSMGFTRKVLQQVPAFDPELGPGTLYGYFDDTLFSYQVLEAGFRITTVLDAPVVHVPDEKRLSRPAYLRAAACRGRGLAYIDYHWKHQDEEHWTRRSRWWQLWRHPYLVLLKRLANLWAWRSRHPKKWLFRKEGIAYREFAFINQLYQIWQFILLQHAPRNYEENGLVKRHGDEPKFGSPSSLEDHDGQISA